MDQQVHARGNRFISLEESNCFFNLNSIFREKNVSVSHTKGCRFASRPGHTKGHHKMAKNCLPALHAWV